MDASTVAAANEPLHPTASIKKLRWHRCYFSTRFCSPYNIPYHFGKPQTKGKRRLQESTILGDDMYRFTLFALLSGPFQFGVLAGDDPKDKKAELRKAIENADLILVGKVTKTGLVAASSFDVGEIEASKVLKGDEKIKSAQFRFSGRMVPSYAKVGVEGVWVLSKADNKPGWRNVLSFQPIAEEGTVKTLIKEEKAKKDRQATLGDHFWLRSFAYGAICLHFPESRQR
jgi:hypothetical protein